MVPKEFIPYGVDQVRPIAAYQSWGDFKTSFNPTPVKDVRDPNVASLIAVLAHKFLVPDNPDFDDMKSLEAAANLARDDEFRGERNVFHKWLDDKIRARMIEKDVVNELDKKIRAFKWDKRFDRARVPSRSMRIGRLSSRLGQQYSPGLTGMSQPLGRRPFVLRRLGWSVWLNRYRTRRHLPRFFTMLKSAWDYSGEARTPTPKNLCGSRTCKPNSVCGIAPAGRSFLWAAHYCAAQATYPEVVTRRAGTFRRSFRSDLGPSLFGLAPCGVCPARCITAAAVRSYRTFSPLPRASEDAPGGMFSVALAVNRA